MKVFSEKNEGSITATKQKYISGAKYTVEILEQAPVVIFAVNPLGKSVLAELTPEKRIYEVYNIQSIISASIQNIFLEATQKGIGSF